MQSCIGGFDRRLLWCWRQRKIQLPNGIHHNPSSMECDRIWAVHGPRTSKCAGRRSMGHWLLAQSYHHSWHCHCSCWRSLRWPLLLGKAWRHGHSSDHLWSQHYVSRFRSLSRDSRCACCSFHSFQCFWFSVLPNTCNPGNIGN